MVGIALYQLDAVSVVSGGLQALWQQNSSCDAVMCYATHNNVIYSFADKLAAEIFTNRVPKGFLTDIPASARRKLAITDAAETLNDLRSPPGDRLEALKGDRTGQHSIRINDQWRVCFVWKDGAPHEVEIVDYHGR